MKSASGDTFSDRLLRASDARKAIVAKFRPKPSVIDPALVDRAASRAAERAVELTRVRLERTEAKVARKQAAEHAVLASAAAVAAAESEALALKRGDRKERKLLTKAEAKAKRDARYAARQARR